MESCCQGKNRNLDTSTLNEVVAQAQYNRCGGGKGRRLDDIRQILWLIHRDK